MYLDKFCLKTSYAIANGDYVFLGKSGKGKERKTVQKVKNYGHLFSSISRGDHKVQEFFCEIISGSSFEPGLKICNAFTCRGPFIGYIYF